MNLQASFQKAKTALKAFFSPPADRKKGPFDRILDLLSIVSGGFFLAMYIPYFLWHALRGHPADTAAALLVFAGVLLPFFFRHPLKRLIKRWYKPLKIFWCAGMCFYMVTFLIFCGIIYSHEDVSYKESEKQTVVVVFGCQVFMDGRPSAELRSRIDAAEKVLKDHPDAICITAGGKGDNEPMPEGKRMKELLVEKGIAEERILTEERSTSTAENLTFALEILKNEGYDKDSCSFIFVSSSFHTPRILLLGKRAGLTSCATYSGDSPYPFLEFLYVVREYMSYVYLFLFG
jgi:uncharacterized SAM-binding protein YcdF (DUF218 family)